MRLEGKVAIVTGGGSGIGRATAQRLAADGATVAVVDIDMAQAEETAKQIGGRASAHQVDVSQRTQIEAAVADIRERHQRIDILINNAGIARDATAKKLTEEAWDLVMNVNLKGTFLFCQAVIPALTEAGGGRIVNTASIAILGNFGQSSYSASKAGVVGLTRTLALELARASVTVNCVAPGATDTPMVAGIPDEIRSQLVARIPLKRLAKPEEIAALHAFLASDDASYITGQVFFCDGGASLGA